MAVEKYIPIESEAPIETDWQAPSKCAESEPYALMVLGDSMEPEFKEGDVIVIEPDGHVQDGSFVIAYHNDEYIFRQLVIKEERWFIKPLNEAYETQQLSSPDAVKGLITQKKGRGRRNRKNYV
jgi:DNA polymerase V